MWNERVGNHTLLLTSGYLFFNMPAGLVLVPVSASSNDAIATAMLPKRIWVFL